MSFTTDNNNENAVKDPKLNAEEKSPLRRMAEERAERIRYAEEYRRKLEAEKAPVQPKKTKAAEQKEQAKLEKIEQEKAEVRAKLEEDKLESERRLAEAAEKIKAISENMDKAETAAEEPTVEEAESSPEPLSDAEPAEVEPLMVHIPIQSFSVPCTIKRKMPEMMPPVYTEDLGAQDIALTDAPAIAPVMGPVIDIVPDTVEESKPVPESAPSVAEDPFMQTIDVTSQFRRTDLTKPAITYGRRVTRGGWEHTIIDDDDIEKARNYYYDTNYETVEYPEEDNRSGAAVAAAALGGAAVGAAAVGAGAAYLAKQKQKPASNDDPYRMYDDVYPDVEEQNNAPVQSANALSDKSDASSTNEAQGKTENGNNNASDAVSPSKKMSKKEKKKAKKAKKKAKKKNLYIDDENNSDEYDENEADARAVYAAGYGAETLSGVSDAHYIEDEHLRYLRKTRELEKLKDKSSAARLYGTSSADFLNSNHLDSVLQVGSELIGMRMDYSAIKAKGELDIELLKFSTDTVYDKQAYDSEKRKIKKMKRSARKAKKLEKKATKRYYKILRNELEKPSTPKKMKKQDQLREKVARLEFLLREREQVDARLHELYTGAESKAGGKISLVAEKKRFNAAKKVRRSLMPTYTRIENSNAPDALKAKLRYLFNTKIVSKSTITYSKFLLRKLRPKNDAKRALKNDIKNAKRSLNHVEDNIRRLIKKINKYIGARRFKTFFFVLLLILLVAVVIFIMPGFAGGNAAAAVMVSI